MKRGDRDVAVKKIKHQRMRRFFWAPQEGIALNFNDVISGGLAQLVERLLRKQEVTGSTPVISTNNNNTHPLRVGIVII